MSDWHGCYDESWKDLIVPEAFAHPAKMARSLLDRILDHAFAESWLHEGSIVCDPFFGIGSTGILGAYRKLQVYGVELELKFCLLAEQNFKLHDNAWRKLGNPRPVMVQGDSRRLCEILSECDCIVSSPPFLESLGHGEKETSRKEYFNKVAGASGTDYSNYGSTPGQLGAMKPGSVDAVISSPPFQESLQSGDTSSSFKAKYPDAKCGGDWGQHYGSTPGNLGNLKPGSIDCVLSSPPYENAQNAKADSPEYRQKFNAFRDAKYGKGHSSNKFDQAETQVGSTDGQLGQEQGPTFWAAAQQIVQQCYQILKPNGVAIWVVKSFVRKGQIVDFPGDWRRLCESAGFEMLHEHHAKLVKESRKPSLFGHEIVKTTERKSFFRRLSEKRGSPKIDWEVILCCQKKHSQM